MKKIHTVLVNYKGEKNTLECLDSLSEVKTSGFELHVVLINNSPDDKINVSEEKYKKVNLKVVYNEENLGFSGGANVGIGYAIQNNADYVLIQNNDTLVNNNFLQIMFDFMEANNSVGIVSPKIYFAKGFEFHKDRYSDPELGKVIWYAGGKIDWRNVIGHNRGVDEVDSGQYDEALKTDFATGCSMLVRQEVFEKVGLFDENYFLYYEDADFSVRAKRASFGVYFLPSSIVWHKNAGSAGGSGSDLQDYYISRNRLFFGVKYAPIRSKIALIKEGLANLFSKRTGQKHGSLDFFRGKMGKSSKF